MKLWAHKIEKIVDILIPYCLIFLIIILIIDLGFDTLSQYHTLVLITDIADYMILLIFALVIYQNVFQIWIWTNFKCCFTMKSSNASMV